MVTTDVDMASRALVIVGSAPISSFSDEGDEAVAANILYPASLETLLGRYKWRFATKMEQLSRHTDPPVHKFDAAYQKPADLITLHGVYINNYPIEYDTYGEYIMCDAAVTDAVFADFSFQPDEALFPPYFRTALEFELASLLATAVAGDADMAQALAERANAEYIRATHQDASGQTVRKVALNRFSRIRRSNPK